MCRFSTIALGSLVVAFAVVGASLAQADTLAEFNFDSISGQTVTDISGNGHDATFYSSGPAVALSNDNPFGLAGDKSVALSSAYASQIAYLANPAAINLNSTGAASFTMEGWIKPATTGAMELVGLGSSSWGGGSYFELGTQADGKPVAKFYVGDGGRWFNAVGADSLPLNTWTHLAFVYAGGPLDLYVNGKDAAHADPDLGTPTSLGLVYLGSPGGWGSFGQTNGLIDDIRISSAALTPSQLGYYGSFTVPEPTSLVLVMTGMIGLLAYAWRKRKCVPS